MTKLKATIFGFLFGLIFSGTGGRYNSIVQQKAFFLAGRGMQITLFLVLLIVGALMSFSSKTQDIRSKLINFVIFALSGAVAMIIAYYGQQYIYLKFLA